jgi:hypothetical protein
MNAQCNLLVVSSVWFLALSNANAAYEPPDDGGSESNGAVQLVVNEGFESGSFGPSWNLAGGTENYSAENYSAVDSSNSGL